MSEIQITPLYKDVKPTGIYVYIHSRKTTGEPFYVGKGSKTRGWAKASGRKSSPKWLNVANKHGISIDICQDSLSDEEANLLEMWLIAKLRHEGFDLANITDGGEGTRGIPKTPEWKDFMSARQSKIVFCSNGMVFGKTVDAVKWLDKTGIKNVSSCNINAAANGRRKSAYGYSWWYEGFCEKEYISKEQRISEARIKEVGISLCNSDGQTFSSGSNAVKAMKKIGYERASSANIISAAKGVFGSAYGRSWWIGGCDPKEYKSPGQRRSEALIMHHRFSS